MESTLLKKPTVSFVSQEKRERVKKSLEELNIDQVIGKIAFEENLSIDQLKEIEIQYKDFLFLCGIHKNVCPTPKIDLLWHNHILDTAKYDDFCQKTFGRKIHHKPHYLKQSFSPSTDSKPDLIERTSSLFLEEFGYNPFANIKAESGCNDKSQCCQRCDDD